MDKERELLESESPMFGIYQIENNADNRNIMFTDMESLNKRGYGVKRENYNLVYTAPLPEDLSLEGIYEMFNIRHPADFNGHSLSVSDVVVINNGSDISAHYVDTIGFADIPGFISYKTLLQKYAGKNYEDFKQAMIAQPSSEVFKKAYRITDYEVLSGYFIGEFDLSEKTCKYLCKSEDKVLDMLYREYVSYDSYSLEDDEKITDFINDVRACDDPDYSEKKGPEM